MRYLVAVALPTGVESTRGGSTGCGEAGAGSSIGVGRGSDTGSATGSGVGSMMSSGGVCEKSGSIW